jgi:hypothetical protein
MKPEIEHTTFGTITIDGTTYDHDVLIRLDGSIKKRKKKLSKEVYGTSHTLSLQEAEFIFEKGARRLIIGAGQQGGVHLSDEAKKYFKQQDCEVDLYRTPDALKEWNDAQGHVIALFHVTC